MKVIIKKYPKWVGPYQLVENIFFWSKTENELGYKEPSDWVDGLSEKFADSALGEMYTRIANKVFDYLESKRVYIKIDKFDTWSMDSTLAFIILPMLEQLKEQKNGVPVVSNEDVPDHLFMDEYDYENYDLMEKRWDYILDQIIYSFKCVHNDDLDYMVDIEETKLKNIKIQKGLILFGKYYQNLWT